MENFKKKRKGSFLASFSDYPDFGLLAPSFGKNKNFLQKTTKHFFPAGDYMLKVNNRNTTARCEICSKLTIKTPE